MLKITKKSGCGAALAGAALLLSGSSAAYAAANDAISGDFGYTYNSHFVSFGADVWGAGGSFYGSRATSSFYGDVAVKPNDALTLSLGVWSDVNDNVKSNIGGHLQEVDFNPGISYAFGKFTAGLTFGAWSYAGDVEEVIDTTLSYDDTGLLAPNFALNPKVDWHYRTSGNGGQKIGSAIVFSVDPSFPITMNFSIAIPAGIALFTTDDFQGGHSSGYSFSYIGGSFDYALGFIPNTYGTWSTNFDLIAYFTDSTAIPGNPSSSFLTGQLGIKVAY